MATSVDGFVMSGLKANKYGDRSNRIGKRFGTLKSGVGFGLDKNFHSIQRSVITLLERAGAIESTVQHIARLERSTLTGRTYSGKSTLEMRREVLANLAYGETQSV